MSTFPLHQITAALLEEFTRLPLIYFEDTIISNMWAVAASKGGMGVIFPQLALPPLAPQSEEKLAKISHFLQISCDFCPLRIAFCLLNAPHNKISGAATACRRGPLGLKPLQIPKTCVKSNHYGDFWDGLSHSAPHKHFKWSPPHKKKKKKKNENENENDPGVTMIGFFFCVFFVCLFWDHSNNEPDWFNN